MNSNEERKLTSFLKSQKPCPKDRDPQQDWDKLQAQLESPSFITRVLPWSGPAFALAGILLFILWVPVDFGSKVEVKNGVSMDAVETLAAMYEDPQELEVGDDYLGLLEAVLEE